MDDKHLLETMLALYHRSGSTLAVAASVARVYLDGLGSLDGLADADIVVPTGTASLALYPAHVLTIRLETCISGAGLVVIVIYGSSPSALSISTGSLAAGACSF